MNKIKTLISKFGIVIFSFLLMAYSPQEGWSADKSTSSVVKTAESGDAEDQSSLCKSYYGPEEFPIDKEKEIYWYKKAAEKGNVEAQYELGLICFDSWDWDFPKEDSAKGSYWFEKAAKKGHVKAQRMLGLMYYYGRLPMDHKKAVFWFEKSAKQGDVEAQYNLGKLYDRGIEVPEDNKKALYWWKKAAKQGDWRAQWELSEMYKDGDDGVPMDHKKAAYWSKKWYDEYWKGS